MMGIELGLIGVILYALMILIITASLYIAHKYTHTFESHLPNCKLITDNQATYREAGLPGKIVRCGMMYIFLIFPALGKKRGLMDLGEAKSFPTKMKYLLFIPWTAQILIFIALIWFTQFAIPRA
ncbi:hypothetical protein AAY86_15320 [Pseudomonas amygdali pv. tabaci str. ATCC 11528]|uniref:hypothetical protein n=1 Tax=Pseudomonas amygdali TaxID=47877 RepID=UPI0001BC8CE6|nr:hypothetical protein [Pseudomonas amygdali]KEZ69154.1 hypothetical protein C1E_0208535 [Pseudomonas amygdali pv. tabaci str. ATCC 11528]KKY51744.1 hypothetical protein AAY86_15320 [Pseudomonas amygdali pv. tabaci str. ATCC 11528]QED86632.1 hypothetical protein PSYTB_24755 [Pseudomonas amygdali pv. tabaci str. ATCC 11528]